MTLAKKIVKNFLAATIACILLFSISITFLLRTNSKTFYEDTRDMRSETIKNTTHDLLTKKETDKLNNFLKESSQSENMDIELIDSDGQRIVYYKGLKKNKDKSEKIDDYRIVDSAGSPIAELKVTYHDRSNIYMLERLHKNISDGIIISLVIALPIVLLIAKVLSNNLASPIKNILDATYKIRNENYDINFERANVDELEDLQQSITYLAKNLENQVTIRKQYAQDISHELRTPITNLRLYLEAIKDGMMEANEETTSVMLDQVDRLSALVVNLKMTFDNNVENVKLKLEKFNLSSYLNSIADSFMAQANSKDICIIRMIPEDIYIVSDKDKINHIVSNLISNAIKAIGKSGNIKLRLSEDKSKIRIYVEDDGIGIDKDKIPLIFERFYRIDDARNTKENGHGLGLSISENFVKSLGGRIDVESKVNEGSTFIVELENRKEL